MKLWTVWSDQPNQYDEPKGDLIEGVYFDIYYQKTRLHTWTIGEKPICGSLIAGKPSVVGVAGRAPAGRSPAGGSPPKPWAAGAPVSRSRESEHRFSTPWSTVNNCTHITETDMKTVISEGQVYSHEDGSMYEVINVKPDKVTFRTSSSDLVQVDPASLFQDLDYGILELSDSDEDTLDDLY